MIDPSDIGGPGSPRPVTPPPTPTPYVVPAAPRTVPGWLWPLVAACAVAITGAVLWGVLMRPAPAPGPGPAPAPVADYDPAFVPVGKALAVQFGKDFGAAIGDGAKLLDAGQSRTAASDTVVKAFATNRTASFDKLATPALEKVVPQSKAEEQVTTGERQALARAYRGLQKGAEGR